MLRNNYYAGMIEAGCDEAGRGCLAGPVYAAAVILPPDYPGDKINDSKTLSPKARYALRREIISGAVAWAVGVASVEEIDRMNILRASILAMHRALDHLSVRPEAIIVDGDRFLAYRSLPFSAIIKGDGKYLSIAAASILAKTYRDDYMNSEDLVYPEYGWRKNKGYPTGGHREALRRYGVTPLHRRSFRLFETERRLPFDS